MNRVEVIKQALEIAYRTLQTNSKMPIEYVLPVMVISADERLVATDPMPISPAVFTPLAEMMAKLTADESKEIHAVGLRTFRDDCSGYNEFVIGFEDPI
ncbi:MAG: hypothetical protein NTY30_05075 [Candidatus Berkelbacteria bacterium]|nr:hypothetical protein [Candidatus Berkelbacteria bacterium]